MLFKGRKLNPKKQISGRFVSNSPILYKVVLEQIGSVVKTAIFTVGMYLVADKISTAKSVEDVAKDVAHGIVDGAADKPESIARISEAGAAGAMYGAKGSIPVIGYFYPAKASTTDKK